MASRMAAKEERLYEVFFFIHKYILKIFMSEFALIAMSVCLLFIIHLKPLKTQLVQVLFFL